VRRALLVVTGLCVLAGAVGQAQAPSGPGVYYPPLLLRDEGTDQGRMGRAINFTGAGVSCSYAAGVGTCSISGGGGGSANVVEKSIVLTAVQPNPAPATVTGQTWVTSSSVILCGVLGTTADGLTPEAINVANLGVTVENRVAGTSFDIRVVNWYGLEGTVRIHCTGV
jgi:hypothetical protein